MELAAGGVAVNVGDEAGVYQERAVAVEKERIPGEGFLHVL